MLPIPRSEMAWATAARGRMHVVGGYGLQQVNRPYHHIYDPAADRWTDGAPIPLGANHIGIVATQDTVWCFGGMIDQNRNPHREAFAYDIAADRWRGIAPLPRAFGAMSAAHLDGKIHLLGGAAGVTQQERRSVPWHVVYDIAADRYETLPDMPGFPLDHKGVVTMEDRIHVIGGRINSFATNVGHHRVFRPATGQWQDRAPMPTPRSGHGTAILAGRIFCMGGEETGKVFAQMESYDPATNTWQSHAPMITARHGLGCAAIGDRIYVAGGGPIVGGGVQSAIHEAFSLG
jgi:N-acetylneuraminic acid mutarotase